MAENFKIVRVGGDAFEATIEMRLDRKALQDFMRGSPEIGDALMRAAQVGETEAKQLAPVDTGNLRRSITHEVGKDSDGQYGRYGTNVEYGLWQEIGTRFHAAQPYLRPALEAVRRFIRG